MNQVKTSLTANFKLVKPAYRL